MRTLLSYSVLLSLLGPGVAQAQLRAEGVNTVSGAPTDRFEPRRYHALLIGVQDYDDPRLKLDHPVADAEALKDVLIKNYLFDSKDVTVLKNPRRSAILRALDSLRSALGRSDNLLVFFAGHGSLDTVIDRGYWWPADASRDHPDNQISVLDIRDRIKAIQAQHTLVIADACFAGAMVLKMRGDPNETMNLAGFAALDRDASRRVMTSGALTAVPDKSIFMKYLLLRLSENTDQAFTANELYSKLQIEVPSNRGPTPQYTVIDDANHRGGEFIFVRRAPTRVVASGSDLETKKPSATEYDIPALKAHFKEIRFFDSDSVLTPMGQRVYASKFYTGATRFVGAEIELDYDAPPGRVVSLPAACTYYAPDNSVVGVTRNELRSEAAWKGIVWWVGLGWSTPGYWTAGTNRVKCEIAGRTFASGSFEVTATRLKVTSPISSIAANVTTVRFWEQAFGDWQHGDERHYETTFDAATARTIGTELELHFPAPGRSVEIPISCTRYWPDGTELGKQEGKFSPEPTWTASIWTPGPFGWEDTGNFKVGVYRVECFAEGRLIAEGSFEVTSAVVIPSIGARLTAVRFWEESKKLEAKDRKFVTSFISSQSHYIGIQLQFEKPAGSPRVTVQLTCTRYWPDGKELGTQTAPFDADPSWTAFTWTPPEGGLGWAEAGTYKPGEYRVQCTADGNVIVNTSFLVKRE